MKRTAVLVSLALLASPGVARGQSPAQKIGVFDASRLSGETELGKVVTARLTALQDKKKADLQAKGKAVQELQNQLDTKSLSLSPEKRTALEKDIQKKSLELSQAQEAARSELQLEYNEEQEKFQQKLLAAIEQFSRDEKFAIIFEKNSAAYVDPSLDVTTALVDRFNKMFPPPPAPEEAKPEGKK